MFKSGEGAVSSRPATAAAFVDIRPTVTIENGHGTGNLVIVCDHASNHIPSHLGTLGLAEDDLKRHIAWDPGALGVARLLSRDLDAPLIHSSVSRLVIDCNRDPSAPDAIVTIGETTPVPGNQHVTPSDRAWRIAEVYEPFHSAIDEIVTARRAAGPVGVLSVHTYTPVFKGVVRPWHAGILFDRDDRLGKALFAIVSTEKGLVVAENEPYSPRDRVYHTLDRHAQSVGLPSVMIEIRNDLVADAAGEAEWAARLGNALHRAWAGLNHEEPPAGGTKYQP